jgi:hypothetical protein
VLRCYAGVFLAVAAGRDNGLADLVVMCALIPGKCGDIPQSEDRRYLLAPADSKCMPRSIPKLPSWDGLAAYWIVTFLPSSAPQ